MLSSKKKVLFTSHTANFQKFNRPFMRMLREQGYEVHYASMGEEQIEDCDKQFVVPFTRSPFTLSNVRYAGDLHCPWLPFLYGCTATQLACILSHRAPDGTLHRRPHHDQC